jgi:hypothetical protein
MQILNSGCVVLPDVDKILVLGFFHTAYQKTAALFDINEVYPLFVKR